MTAHSAWMVSEGMRAALPVYLWGDPGRSRAEFRAVFDRMAGESRLALWDGSR